MKNKFSVKWGYPLVAFILGCFSLPCLLAGTWHINFVRKYFFGVVRGWKEEHGDWRITKTGSEVRGMLRGCLGRREEMKRSLLLQKSPGFASRRECSGCVFSDLLRLVCIDRPWRFLEGNLSSLDFQTPCPSSLPAWNLNFSASPCSLVLPSRPCHVCDCLNTPTVVRLLVCCFFRRPQDKEYKAFLG